MQLTGPGASNRRLLRACESIVFAQDRLLGSVERFQENIDTLRHEMVALRARTIGYRRIVAGVGQDIRQLGSLSRDLANRPA